VQASAYWSARPSMRRDGYVCSGAMYAKVPTMVPTAVCPGALESTTRTRPKSVR
jgi:hypothetical protein